jgi:hypothetical protein
VAAWDTVVAVAYDTVVLFLADAVGQDHVRTLQRAGDGRSGQLPTVDQYLAGAR